MTPHEKAKELYNKYFTMIKIESYIDRVSSIPYVKKCALIAVEEILNDPFYTNTINISGVYYWQEVKKEIEAL